MRVRRFVVGSLTFLQLLLLVLAFGGVVDAWWPLLLTPTWLLGVYGLAELRGGKTRDER